MSENGWRRVDSLKKESQVKADSNTSSLPKRKADTAKARIGLACTGLLGAEKT